MKKKYIFALRSSLFLGVLAFPFTHAYATNNPAWWTQSQTSIFVTGTYDDDHFAPINVGQLKFVASRAKAYLDTQMTGQGLSPSQITVAWQQAFNPFDNPFSDLSSGDNWAPVTAQELRFFAYGFYRLLAMQFGYDTKRSLLHVGVSHQNTSVRNGYTMPWSEFYLLSENSAPVNIGQLKAVFSFDLSYDLSYIGQTYAMVDTDADNDLIDSTVEKLSGQNETGFTSADSALSWPANTSIQQSIQGSGISGGVTIVLPNNGVYILNPPNLVLNKL